jgi:uncharacterized protein
MLCKLNTEELVRKVRQLRSAYNEVKKALPWLDGCVWEEDEISFRGFHRNIETPYIRSVELQPSMKGRLSSLRYHDIRLLRYNPSFGSIDQFSDFFPQLAENNIPLVLLHTDVAFEDIGRLANTFTSLNIIVESGPRKLIYFMKDIKKILGECMNVYLCTFNFCNWHGHEEIVGTGLANKLLYGSHMPEYSADASMGQIIISNLDWETKCDIAGNNLRRLLGLKPVKCPEVKYEQVKPFVIDSHAHNIQFGGRQLYKMPTPDMNFHPADWIDFMDLCSVEQIYLTPATVLMEKLNSSLPYVQDLIDFSPQRFFYYEVFSPVEGDTHIGAVCSAVKHPGCIGIKIHPSFHKVDADDDRFEKIYRLADACRTSIMTHSWEISSYNPDQYRSHPEKFRKHLGNFRNTPFVLGHAGGRPSAFEATISVCREFPNVYVDLAGDYYNNGLIDILADRLGADRILFASDVDWVDTRCNLSPVIASSLKDEDVLKILRTNALKVFRKDYMNSADTKGTI